MKKRVLILLAFWVSFFSKNCFAKTNCEVSKFEIQSDVKGLGAKEEVESFLKTLSSEDLEKLVCLLEQHHGDFFLKEKSALPDLVIQGVFLGGAFITICGVVVLIDYCCSKYRFGQDAYQDV